MDVRPERYVSEIACTIMRGGTSKALMLEARDLPADPAARDRLILRLFGSPDPRQIDGLGGADPLTSKVAVIGDPPDADHDLSYLFGQVEIARAAVDWRALCGNLTAAVGAYAVHTGRVRATEGVTRVRVFSVNLRRRLTVEVPTAGGRVVERGDYAIPGVPGTGARIMIDFSDTGGAGTGRGLLPTGEPREELAYEGGRVSASLVDIGNPMVFVAAADVGLSGHESAAGIDGDPGLLACLEAIRGAAAVRMGLASEAGRAVTESPAVPLIAAVASPAEGGSDLLARLLFMQRTHKTYAGTASVCTGVAARLPGTLVHALARPGGGSVRITHPLGTLTTEIAVSGNGVERAALGRTARLLMRGTASLDAASLDAA